MNVPFSIVFFFNHLLGLVIITFFFVMFEGGHEPSFKLCDHRNLHICFFTCLDVKI